FLKAKSLTSNLEQFLKAGQGWKSPDYVYTNQFWPMDSASTFGAKGHDIKFGTEAMMESKDYHLPCSDDGQLHNCFFGMNFEVDFELTDDYVGPLNYYFFGDDDMWVFLEDPEGNTQLICDIGGVHQAAGEYVDLWNYIEKPQGTTSKSDSETERPKEKYKLKFFYTERGASGSTCWMQFTLPSVNAVPVIDYTGGVKNTLTVNKEINGNVIDRAFDFKIEFEGEKPGVATNKYTYQIREKEKDENGNVIKDENGKDKEVIVKTDSIHSGGIFQLKHGQIIEVFGLPDKTKYTITEADYPEYKPGVGEGSTGQITANETVEGNINWKEDDLVHYINNEIPYELPETGGSGMELYTIAGALCLVFGAGFLYRKKFRERRA
ncbi:MAG TPA: hypothetical protein DD414_01360, partial [Lachnospiraceae bacterium]|nr:hypothetical protein [Lachnospiraceae bacterium]